MTNEQAQSIQSQLEQVSDVCSTMGVVKYERAQALEKAALIHGGDEVVAFLRSKGCIVAPLFWQELVNVNTAPPHDHNDLKESK